MATITSLGVGSGLNINAIVTQLVDLERRPLQQMQTDSSRLQTQVSSYGRMQSLFSNLQTASNALNNNTLWSQSKASSADETAVSTTGGNSAAAGSYAITVRALAGSQTVASDAIFPTAATPVGGGTLTLSLGRWNADQSALTPKADSTPVVLDISDTDTLQSVRDKINGAGAGVSAAIVSDTNGVRLSLRSTLTGAENGFSVVANDPSGAGLARLAYDPASGAAGPGSMQLKAGAADALASVNGIDVVSASNDLSGAVEGVTIRLRKVSTTPVDITVSSDKEAVSKAVKGFADAYSELTRFISDQTRFDPASRNGGPLQGDSAATGLQGRLRAVLSADSSASSAFPRLSDLGLQLQRDGTLQINQGKLDDALNKMPELKKAFTNSDSLVPANEGFARRYASLTTGILAVDGSLSTRTDGLKKLIEKNGENQTRLNERVDRFQQRLVQQYTALDGNVARLNSLGSYVTQTVTALNRSGT